MRAIARIGHSALRPCAVSCGGAALARGAFLVKEGPYGKLDVGAKLEASGPDSIRTVTGTLPNKLDCSKAIQPVNLPFYERGGPTWVEISTLTLRPKGVQGVRFGNANRAIAKAQVRAARLVAACGGAVTVSVDLFSPVPTTGHVKLAFGPASKDATVAITNTTPVALEVQAPLDCGAQNGLPTFSYELVEGVPSAAVVVPVVSFTPAPLRMSAPQSPLAPTTPNAAP